MNALKAVSRTEDELRVANYLVLFGSRDLEGIASPRKNADGTVGEYFTKATQFDSPYTKAGFLYVDWEHGQAPDGEPQRDDVLGYVDWKTAQIDENGLFVERVLNRHAAYMEFLEELIDAGVIGSSTEPIQDGVQKGEDGEIKAWPLMRDTLTVTPMEPRMKTDNIIQAAKALGLVWSAVEKSTVDEMPTVEKSTVDIQEPSEADGEIAEPEAGRTPAAAIPEAGDGSTDDAKALELLLLEIELMELEVTL